MDYEPDRRKDRRPADSDDDDHDRRYSRDREPQKTRRCREDDDQYHRHHQRPQPKVEYGMSDALALLNMMNRQQEAPQPAPDKGFKLHMNKDGQVVVVNANQRPSQLQLPLPKSPVFEDRYEEKQFRETDNFLRDDFQSRSEFRSNYQRNKDLSTEHFPQPSKFNTPKRGEINKHIGISGQGNIADQLR